jgi:hypothetical protein
MATVRVSSADVFQLVLDSRIIASKDDAQGTKCRVFGSAKDKSGREKREVKFKNTSSSHC